MPLLTAIASALSTAPTYAALGDQPAKLLPDDGATDDYFGVSVAIGGPPGNEIAIVGAWGDDDNGSSSGSVYIFDITTGDRIMKLLPSNGSNGDWFGGSVAISDSSGNPVAIVGALGADDNGIYSGSAYLFHTTTGQQLFKLLANDGAAFDNFGCSVAICGAIAIVGAREDYDNGADSGSAYLFDTTTGQQIAKLLPGDGETGDDFGWSVAISGTIAIVGARLDDDNGEFSGSAYLFNTTTGRQIAKLVPDDGAKDQIFGNSVAIGGPPGKEIAIVAAPGDDENGTQSGSVYVYDATTGTQIAKFAPDDGVVLGYFGWSVAISGSLGNEVAVVGTYADNDNGYESGSAYLLDISDPANPTQIAKLLADDGEQQDYLGVSVAISGTTAIVGAYGDDDNGTDSGSAYLFDAASTPGTCPWDVNGDGVVDHRDLVEVVHNLGLCDDPDNCPWDVTGDGVLNGRDVAAVATHFGACP